MERYLERQLQWMQDTGWGVLQQEGCRIEIKRVVLLVDGSPKSREFGGSSRGGGGVFVVTEDGGQ